MEDLTPSRRRFDRNWKQGAEADSRFAIRRQGFFQVLRYRTLTIPDVPLPSAKRDAVPAASVSPPAPDSPNGVTSAGTFTTTCTVVD
jgi:hypothetical protein